MSSQHAMPGHNACLEQSRDCARNCKEVEGGEGDEGWGGGWSGSVGGDGDGCGCESGVGKDGGGSGNRGGGCSLRCDDVKVKVEVDLL